MNDPPSPCSIATHFLHPQQIKLNSGKLKYVVLVFQGVVSSLQFSPDGTKFIGVENRSRSAAIWHCNELSYPCKILRCQTKQVNEACFLNSSSLVATCGTCISGRSVCIWDTLLPPASSLTSSCSIPNLGGTALSYSPASNILFVGSLDGSIVLFDMRQRKVCTFFIF